MQSRCLRLLLEDQGHGNSLRDKQSWGYLTPCSTTPGLLLLRRHGQCTLLSIISQYSSLEAASFHCFLLCTHAFSSILFLVNAMRA
jgi:hypothetical protein